jgi:hypothetical protein
MYAYESYTSAHETYIHTCRHTYTYMNVFTSGFDFVVVYSCPDGRCSEVYRYSDRKIVMCCSWFDYLKYEEDIDYKHIEYFSNEVDCNHVALNTNEVRVRFISDGPVPRDIDPVNKNLVYQGFSASYASSSAPLQESIGCAPSNRTLSEVQGSILSVTDWIIPWSAASYMDWSEDGINSNYLKQGSPFPYNTDNDVMYYELQNGRNCPWRYIYQQDYGYEDDTYEHECGDTFGRGQTKWWNIKPRVTAAEADEPRKIELIFHELVLEDSLDVLTIYTCKSGRCQELRKISGAYPFRGTEGSLGASSDDGSGDDSSEHGGGGGGDDEGDGDSSPPEEPENPDPDTQQNNSTGANSSAGHQTGGYRRQSAGASENRCNRLIVEADEVRLKLTTSYMPTNSSGFWISYRTDTLAEPIPDNDAYCEDNMTRYITAAEGCISFNPRGPPYAGLDGYTPSYADVWGIPPNGKGVWVIKPESAATITLYPPDLRFEKGYYRMRILFCKEGACTQLYKDMTGNIRFTNSFCEIYQKTDEIRVEVTFDETNNMDSNFQGLCYTSTQTDDDPERPETTGTECGYEVLSASSGELSATIEMPQGDSQDRLKPRTWVIDPGRNTTSITLAFSRFSLAWLQAMIVSWDCDETGECAHEKTVAYARPSDADWDNYLQYGYSYYDPYYDYWPSADSPCPEGENLFQCYIKLCDAYLRSYASEDEFYEWCYLPPPQLSSMVIPSSKVQIRLLPVASYGPSWKDFPNSPGPALDSGESLGFAASYTSSNSTRSVPPLLDGDARLTAPGARNVLNGSSGSITFDAVKWMAARPQVITPLGINASASRVQWIIRPSAPTKQITINFDYMDLSPDDFIDMLYIIKDCNTPAERAWFLDYTYDFVYPAGTDVYVLNGLSHNQGGFKYKPGQVPCSITLESSCIAIEYDFPLRFANPGDFTNRYSGFGLTYSSSNAVPSRPLEWTDGAALKACTPDYIKVPEAPLLAPALCCQDEPGNDVFGKVNFWANISIDPRIPEGQDEEDFKVIYKVEPYYEGASTLAQEVKCDTDPTYLESLPGWYPSSPRKVNMSAMDWYSDCVLFPDLAWCPKDAQVDLDVLLANWKAKNPTNPFPAQFLPKDASTASNTSARLWYTKSKVVTLLGKEQKVEASMVLLNGAKPSSDRPLLFSDRWNHVLVSAVTCRRYKAGQTSIWQKSDVSQIDVRLGMGPSITVIFPLTAVSNATLKYVPGATAHQQIALSQPIIDNLVKTLATKLEIKTLKVGGVSRIEAINVTVGRRTTSARRNYKATVQSKQGYVPAVPPAQEGGGDLAVEVFYDANITLSVLCKSIREVSIFRGILSQAAARRQLISSINVVVQVPSTTQQRRGGACLSHYDCLQTSSDGGLFCSKAKVCEVCRLCSIDGLDAIDGKCPRELCPTSGGFPECVNATALVQAAYPCRMTYDFEVWKYTVPDSQGNYVAPAVSSLSLRHPVPLGTSCVGVCLVMPSCVYVLLCNLGHA